ncbi:hypothetical protein OF83DRAFT_1161312 [Amylostereum chailletii]|nr:hypothetical protein OF83DRAFT_1161312 [Amylostereum chailletii]
MKFLLSVAASLPVLALAHGPGQHHVARQAPPVAAAAASSSAASTAASSASSAAASAASAATSAAAPSASVATGAAPSLLSTNPTAVPLTSIAATAATAATQSIPSPSAAGTKPTHISNAPGLPDASKLVVANYPALDKTPPTDSPQVLQWIQDVKNSGIEIPGFSATVAGGCPANLDAVNDASRCWWTCGGCTRNTDITVCPNKLTWGLTYDDGPASYTPDLLNYLDSAKLKSTFYVVGSRALSYPGLLQAEYLAGHEISVHTWAHPQLTTLTNEQIIAELGWTKKIIQDVLGVTPLYMRPPYGDIDDRVRAICKAMNLTPVMWTRISPTATFDTEDFDIHGGTTTVNQVLNNWQNILSNATSIDTGFIVLEHDLFQQTVEVATGYILPDALAHKPAFDIKPVIECRGLTAGDSYLETNNNKTNPLPLSATAAPTGAAQASSSSVSGGSSSDSNGAWSMAPFTSGMVVAAAAAFGAAVIFV